MVEEGAKRCRRTRQSRVDEDEGGDAGEQVGNGKKQAGMLTTQTSIEDSVDGELNSVRM